MTSKLVGKIVSKSVAQAERVEGSFLADEVEGATDEVEGFTDVSTGLFTGKRWSNDSIDAPKMYPSLSWRVLKGLPDNLDEVWDDILFEKKNEEKNMNAVESLGVRRPKKFVV